MIMLLRVILESALKDQLIDVNPASTILCGKTFMKNASIFGTDEYNAFVGMKRDFPNYKVVVVEPKKAEAKMTFKGLTREFMEHHIVTLFGEGSDEHKEFQNQTRISESYPKPLLNSVEPNAAAQAIIDSYLTREGVRLEHEQGDRAFYRPSTDTIVLPLRDQFAETAEYYSTAFHEMTHSTGHAKRLDRLEKTAFFGSDAYSKEELIAEIGAAALVNRCGLETAKSFRNSAAYIQSWLQALLETRGRFFCHATS